jgi:hypothetical protein
MLSRNKWLAAAASENAIVRQGPNEQVVYVPLHASDDAANPDGPLPGSDR